MYTFPELTFIEKYNFKEQKWERIQINAVKTGDVLRLYNFDGNQNESIAKYLIAKSDAYFNGSGWTFDVLLEYDIVSKPKEEKSTEVEIPVYLITMSVFDREKHTIEQIKNKLKDALIDGGFLIQGFIWGHIDVKRVKLVVDE